VSESILELERVRLQYGPVVAVDDVSVTVGKGEFVTLLGPSGSGKTSTLRLVGGFEHPTGGTIRIAGRPVNGLPANRRDTATIFQSGALFPHKTVAENIAYGLRMRKVPAAEIARRVAEILEIVALPGFEHRYPAEMSGGQRQRVALARSLVVRPSLLLFDEPLSALDLSLKLQLRAEIKRLHAELGFSAVFVTHDQGEALSLSDRVAVMAKGRIEQIDRPDTLYNSPANEFVYTFMGESNRLDVTAAGGAIRDLQGNLLPLSLEDGLAEGAWRLYLRPSRLSLSEHEPVRSNALRCTVSMVEFLGEHFRYHLACNGLRLMCDASAKLGLAEGSEVVASWSTADMRAYR